MDVHQRLSYQIARRYTQGYSSSFGLASRLFGASVRPHIYAVYGLVRCADEIVDSYTGADARLLLDALEQETLAAIERGYSPNPLVQAFASTARTYKITHELLTPFFASMRADLTPASMTKISYQRYIYGSAEVVGLMCLRVFAPNEYSTLRPGAQHLGAAYQKINFLRDIAADHDGLGRWYFPDSQFDTFDDAAKQAIITDIQADLLLARQAARQLPRSSRWAVSLSYRLYDALLVKLVATPAARLKQQRVRVSGPRKLWLLTVTLATGGRL